MRSFSALGIAVYFLNITSVIRLTPKHLRCPLETYRATDENVLKRAHSLPCKNTFHRQKLLETETVKFLLVSAAWEYTGKNATFCTFLCYRARLKYRCSPSFLPHNNSHFRHRQELSVGRFVRAYLLPNHKQLSVLVSSSELIPLPIISAQTE